MYKKIFLLLVVIPNYHDYIIKYLFENKIKNSSNLII